MPEDFHDPQTKTTHAIAIAFGFLRRIFNKPQNAPPSTLVEHDTGSDELDQLAAMIENFDPGNEHELSELAKLMGQTDPNADFGRPSWKKRHGITD